MKRSVLAILSICLILGFFSGQTVFAGTAPVDEKAAIDKAIRASISWALTKDRSLLESVISRDDQLFIFNPDAHSTVGWNQFAKGFDFWMDPRFKMERFEIRNLRIHVSISGTVAWWSCILDELAKWDGRITSWHDARWTGVLEKRAGQWLIVQMHFSFAVK